MAFSERSLRNLLTPALRPVRRRMGWWGRSRRRARYMRDGIEGIAMELRTTTNAHAAILREFGARVGNDVSIHGPLQVVNADGDFRHLTIGDRVHLGTDVLIDLADEVVIEDEATLSMRCSIVTHTDVGPGPLKERRPRQQGGVRIGAGAYLGLGATVLHGVTIGAEATVGAHALVDHDVPAGATVVAPRARLAGAGGAVPGMER
jgi:acetyltransferase-like isoleucine patch superfamily enzyme